LSGKNFKGKKGDSINSQVGQKRRGFQLIKRGGGDLTRRAGKKAGPTLKVLLESEKGRNRVTTVTVTFKQLRRMFRVKPGFELDHRDPRTSSRKKSQTKNRGAKKKEGVSRRRLRGKTKKSGWAAELGTAKSTQKKEDVEMATFGARHLGETLSHRAT